MFDAMPPERLDAIAECARNQSFEPGDYLLREGEQANSFFVIRRGDVAIETYVPQRGALTIETLHDGDVLGWSWLFPPYRLVFDARATTPVDTVTFDGRCLRGKFEQDHELGLRPAQALLRGDGPAPAGDSHAADGRLRACRRLRRR